MSIPIQIPMTVSVDVETVPMTLGTEINMRDDSGKADKVAGAVAGDFAGLDENGNLTDSGKKASDFATTEDIRGFYTKPSGGIPASDLASGVIPEVPVQDVQVNGTSILQDGVANVPIAGASTPGVMRVKTGSQGVTIDSDNCLKTSPANSTHVKTGTDGNRPLVPARQHESTFYGLAKAAGADMASLSGETVGVYPEAQKIAIQKMLGIYQAPWELIREDTVTNETEADIEITADGNGQPFELTDIRIEFYSPVQQTTFTKGDYGRIDVFYGSGSSAVDRVFIGAYTQNANASARYSYVIIEQKDGMVTKTYMLNTASGDNGTLRAYSQPTGMFYLGSRTYSKIVIAKVTGTAHYKLFGKRKWN